MGMIWKFGWEDSDGWRFRHLLIDGAGELPPQPAHNGKLWPQNFLSQSECLILLNKISPERLYLLNSFFLLQFSIIIETYKISFGYWWLLEFFADVPHLHYMYILYNILFSSFRYQIKENLKTLLCLSFYIF